MDETSRQGPIPVRELMAHLSADRRVVSEPRDAEAARPESRPAEVAFAHRGTTWTVREAGSATWGTDIGAAAAVVAVHFYHPERPERPTREALLARGRLGSLHPAELSALLEESAEVPPEGTVVASRHRGSGRSGRGGKQRAGRSGRGRERPDGRGRSGGGDVGG